MEINQNLLDIIEEGSVIQLGKNSFINVSWKKRNRKTETNLSSYY